MDVPTIESIAFQHNILDVERGQPSVNVSARVQTQGLVDVLDELVISKRLEKRPQRPRARARTRIVPVASVELVDDPDSACIKEYDSFPQAICFVRLRRRPLQQKEVRDRV